MRGRAPWMSPRSVRGWYLMTLAKHRGSKEPPTDLTCPRTAHFPSPAVIHGHDMLILHAVVLGWGHTVARSNQHRISTSVLI